MPTLKTVHFESDGYLLRGTLHLPDVDHPPFIIGCHGLLADRQSPKQISLGEALSQIGIAYLRFDHRGCGDSQGDINEAPLLPSRCRDLYHAMKAMKTYSFLGPILGLFGSSFGGTVVLASASEHPVPTLISYAAPIRSRSIQPAVAKEIQARNEVSDRAATNFIFDISESISAIRNAIIIHGEHDEIVPLSHAREIYRIINEPKQLIIYDNGDHRMSSEKHQKRFLGTCITWFKNHVKKQP